jgi:hypothetical protein
MDTDLAFRLDRSIGPAPDDVDPLAGLLEQGHRALGRRRLATTAASAVAVLAVAGGVAVATSGDPDRAAPPLVDEPSASPSAAPSETPTTDAGLDGITHTRVKGGMLAQYDPETGALQVDLGTTVLQRVENPYDVAPPARSDALALLAGDGVEWWVALYEDLGSGGSAATPAAEARSNFEHWVRQQGAIATSDDEEPSESAHDVWPGIPADMVAFVGTTEELSPGDGVTILEQRAHVRLGDTFAGPDDRTAAALVRTGGGDMYYVVARIVDGEEQQDIAVPRSKGGADLDAFLDFARERYASGVGLL